MRLLKRVSQYRVESDKEAKEVISNAETKAAQEGYLITAAGYVHKEKKSKGEVIDACELLTITETFGGPWK